MSTRVFLLLLTILGASIAEVFEWAILMMDKERATLTCNDDYGPHQINASRHSDYVLKWKLPTNVVLDNNHSDSMFAVKQGQNGIEGYVLEVKSFEEKYAGVYVCMVEDNIHNNTFKILKGINIHTRKYPSLTAKYEYNIILAVVSTLVFMVLTTGACLVHRFRWLPEEEKAQRKSKEITMKDIGHDNNIMVEVPSKSGAENLKSAEGGGAYENLVAKSDSTQL